MGSPPRSEAKAAGLSCLRIILIIQKEFLVKSFDKPDKKFVIETRAPSQPYFDCPLS